MNMYIAYMPVRIFTLTHIEVLTMRDIVFLEVDEKILLPIRDTLKSLECEWFPIRLTLNDLFQSHLDCPYNIEHLVVGTYSTKFEVIASTNFTNLRKLIYLDLSTCHIVIIRENAFKFIAKTLKYLLLRNNQIAVFAPHVFYDLIDRQLIKIELTNNLIDCDCGLYEFEIIFNATKEQLKIESKQMGICDGDPVLVNNTDEREQCIDLQIIHRSKLCLQLKYEKYLYPRFAIKVVDKSEVITVTIHQRRKYRLWLHNLLDSNGGKSTCPTVAYIENHISCMVFDSRQTTIDPKQIVKHSTNKVHICVNYVTHGPKTFWPLHCILHRRAIDLESYLIVIILGGSSLAGICFSLIPLKYIINKRRAVTQTKSPAHTIIDDFYINCDVVTLQNPTDDYYSSVDGYETIDYITKPDPAVYLSAW